jgi:hypothetical protein
LPSGGVRGPRAACVLVGEVVLAVVQFLKG